VVDEVEISNVGGDGVASEVTLAKLLDAMEKMAGGKSKASKEVERLAKASADATDELEEFEEATAASTEKTKALGAAMGEATRTVLSGLTSGLFAVGKSALSLAGELANGGTQLGDFTRHIPLVGGHLTSLVSLIDENVSSFRELSNVGATFGNGLNDIRHVAAKASMPLGEFTELVSSNSERMKAFGATTAQGAMAFAALSKELRDGPGRSLINMGYTTAELNEGLLDFAEYNQQQMGTGRRNSRLNAKSAADYMKTIDQLAAVTGKRRDQIRDEMNAGMADQRSRLAIARMTTEEGIAFQANLSQSPASFKEALTDMADGIANSEIAQGMMAASDTFRDQAHLIKDMDPTEYNNFLVKVRDELDSKAQSMGAGAEALMASGSGYGQALSASAELARLAYIDEQEAEKQRLAMEAEKEKNLGILGFEETLRNIRGSLMSVLTTGGADSPLNKIQTALGNVAAKLETFIKSEAFTTGIQTLSDTITGFIQNVEDFDFMTAIFGGKAGDEVGSDGKVLEQDVKGIFGDLNIGEMVGGWLKDILWSGSGLIVGAVVGLFALNKVKNALMSGIGGLFGGGGNDSGDGGRPGGGNAGAGLGKGIGNIGKGIGAGLGGVLKGLAKGIAAFANPAVLLGGVNIGLVILGIGAAVAGATWMVGKALPTMAEGMKSFEELDGAGLIAAGKGMAAVGAGLLVFGAGGALGGIGNVIGNIFGAIPGKSPLEKLKDFSDAKLDTTQIENNAKAMMAYSEAMAGFKGGPAPSILGAFATGIVSFFGGETDPMAPIKRFGEMTLNTANIVANAGAVAAYAFAMKDFPTSPAPSVLGAFKSGIVSLLGGETDPMAPIKAFGEMKLNSAQIVSNAFAVSAYAMAIKDFPKSPAADVLGAFKGGISALLGGDKDPMAPIKRFGEMKLDEQSIIDNASAVSAYADAVKDFPKSPAADVFSALKGAIAGLLGGETDPMAPIKRFGEMTLNTANIIANAGAVSAYADAVKDFPASPSADVFGAFKGAVAGLLGGSKDPMAPIRAFGEMTFNTAGIIANAGALSAYADAVKDFPKSPAADVFGAFKGGLVSLLGGKTDPMAPIKAFGDMTFNTVGVVANAGALKAYADAVKDFPTSPAADVFGAFKGGLVSLLGGETDPMAPIKRFGDLSFNTPGIIANAGALKAYASAMKDFPTSPAASVFTALTDGIIGLLGGNTDPFAPMEAFGKRSFNTVQLIANANAVSAFATAMDGMPEIKTEKSGGLFGAIGSFFTGADVMPWDHITKFGAAEIDAAAVVANANAMSAFATALTGMPTGDEIEGKGEFSSKTIAGLERISALTGENITSVATGMTSIANITGLQSNLDILKSGLDTAGVTSYNTAMQALVDTLGDLNKELSKDNNGMFTAGTGTNAGSVMSQTSSTPASNAGTGQLNSTMQEVLKLLQEMRDLDIKVERNTADAAMGYNIAARSPSRGG
jgi:hypothetical protein